jgi:hypothetical protein
VPDHDPRLQTGAYITDGADLFEVIGLQRGPGVMGIRTVRILVENCRNFRGLEFLPEKIQETFELVRHPPVPAVPDIVAAIAWEPAPAGQVVDGCGGSWGVGKAPSINSIR